MVDSYIHVEVLNLHPGAELQHFKHNRILGNQMIMSYMYERWMSGFGHELILGCSKSFGRTPEIITEKMSEDEVNLKVKRFD